MEKYERNYRDHRVRFNSLCSPNNDSGSFTGILRDWKRFLFLRLSFSLKFSFLPTVRQAIPVFD
ncbi:MAG: hypothetical protein COT45_00230 [bacterium (Candidatus Stahlbacteria) CG08_land_8_20_14_0_20_40_26]|nr:MAG: hypothetical protein COT45_00230 [bacterium (Candidatus Stahlbacteria) CG08_land_8_20_14_0_20_40_26]